MRTVLALILFCSTAGAATLTNFYTGQTIKTADLVTQPSAGGGSGSTLTNNLYAYWNLDETSGTRADALGVLDLSDNNTVTSATGLVGNAAHFVASNSEYLNSSSVTIGSDQSYTIALWIKSTDSGTKFVCGMNSTISALDRSTYVIRSLSGVPDFSNGNGSTGTNVSWGSSVADSNWHCVIAWHDAAADTISISVDNGTPQNAAWSGGTYNANPYRFGVGNCGTASSGRYFNGDVDELAIAWRVWTAGERTEFYNSGAGKTYPFTP